MYKILLFSGGLYKYDLLVEHVDDVGGLIIQKDSLQISRDTSFLREEIKVTLIIPSNEISSVRSLAKEIKGEIEELKLEEAIHEKLINSLKVYNILCKSNSGLNRESIEKFMEDEEEKGMFITADSKKDDTNPPIEECLELMLSLEILKRHQKNDEFEYYINLEDKP